MRKLCFVFVAAFSFAGILVGCGNGKGDNTDVAADSAKMVEKQPKTLTPEEAKAFEEKAKEFIADMYNKMWYMEDSFLVNHCTQEVLKKLKEDYSKKFNKGEGYAYWDFRSEKDGDPESERYRVADIFVEPENWFKYTFYDMGVPGFHRIKLSSDNGKFIIEELN